MDKLLCDDGSDGDYAPDVLNPYSIRFAMDPHEYVEYLNYKMRDLHKEQVRPYNRPLFSSS